MIVSKQASNVNEGMSQVIVFQIVVISSLEEYFNVYLVCIEGGSAHDFKTI